MTTVTQNEAFEDRHGASDRDFSILVLVDRDVLGPIFSSIHVQMAKGLAMLGIEAKILAFGSLGEFVKPALRQKWRQLSAEVGRHVGCELTRLPSPPRNLSWLRTDGWMLQAWTVLQSTRWHPEIVHCSSSRAAELALRLKRAHPDLKVVYHCLGPEADEYLYAHAGSGNVHEASRNHLAVAKLNRLQARAFQQSDGVICISNSMVEWAKNQFGLNGSQTLTMPCFVDVERFSREAARREIVRKQLGVDGKFVVCYCGSMISWQLSSKSLRILVALHKMRPDVHFLGITMHRRSLEALLQSVGFPIEKTNILSVSHWDVPKFLAAADVGLVGRGLLQEPNVVHEVSSPIKYGEYLACGTPVIISDGIGDFSSLTKQQGVGVVLPADSTDSHIETAIRDFSGVYLNDSKSVRRQCVRTAVTELDLKVHVGRLSQFFRRLLSGQSNQVNDGRAGVI